jgi:hypothetical protein
MDLKEICPCPNRDCPNQGLCDKCISRHLKGGYLNFCGFQTILPALRMAIEASPDSPTAQKLSPLIDNMLQAYAKLREKHGISEEDERERLKKVAEYISLNGD